MITDKIESLIPKAHFITESIKVNDESRPPLAQRDTRRVIIYLRRTTIGPLVNRQDNEGDTIRARVANVDHIRVPARKWKSIEKLRAMQICRETDTISPNYLYNEVIDTDILANPMSVIFGDSSSASGDAAGIPSLAIYEQGLSIQSVSKATERITHNALSEAGTMMNIGEKKGQFRQSLFDTLYVREGTIFLQSITLEAPTIESLALILMTLDATRYGAGKQVLGNNIKNEVIGLLATRNEPPVTPYTVLAELGKDEDVDKAISIYMKQVKAWNGHFVEGSEIEKIRAALRQDSKGRDQIMKKLFEEAKSYHTFVYGSKEKKKRGRSKKGEEPEGGEEA
jgi:CRISPR-associated protein Csc2